MRVIGNGFILLTLVTTLVNVTSVKGACYPCECYPTMTEPSYMICQGWHVDIFPPALGHYEKQFLKEIFLTETLISCPPTVLPDEYPSLTHFGENNNRLIDCSCLQSWKDVVPEEGFVTECLWVPFPPPSTTPVNNSSSSSSSSSTSDVMDDQTGATTDNEHEEGQSSAGAAGPGEGEGGCCGSSIGPEEPKPPTSPPNPPLCPPNVADPRKRRAFWIVIGVFSPIGALIIVISAVKACYNCWKKRRVIRAGEIAMQVVRNPIYCEPATELEWDALVDEQSRQRAIALANQPAQPTCDVGASSC